MKVKERAYNDLCKLLSLNQEGLTGLNIKGSDPIYRSPFFSGELAAATLAAHATAIANIWYLRNAQKQEIELDVVSAAHALNTVSFLQLYGRTIPCDVNQKDITSFFQTKDQKWVFINASFPKLKSKTLQLLKSSDSKIDLQKAVKQWKALDLEKALTAANLTGAMLRTQESWQQHDQSIALSAQPVINIKKIASGSTCDFTKAKRPLSGIKVLDLTHVLSGPGSARLLAEQGADVVHVRPPFGSSIHAFVLDTNPGKLSVYLDIKKSDERKQLLSLIKQADIFIQSYRPNTLDQYGFSPEQLAEINPNLICVNISCYGDVGPWQDRGGWDQQAQTVTGMAIQQGSLDKPDLTPNLINDYLTGYLAATGALSALIRRQQDGGSYEVKVSLTRTAMWIQSFGLIPTERWQSKPLKTTPPADDLLIQTKTPFGDITRLAPVIQYSETPAYWDKPVVPLGSTDIDYVLERWELKPLK